jgi:CheY-like chemotaxis protein
MSDKSSKRTILYVEDDLIIQMAMLSFLSKEYFDILVADNGTKALHYIFDENLSIDILLTDVNIGEGVNGWEVARCARLRVPTMPVIYTTGVGEDEWIANAVPFSRLCKKPVVPSRVIAVLSSLLGTRAADATVMPIPACLPQAALLLPVQNPAILEIEQIASMEEAPLGRRARMGNGTWVVGPLGRRLYRKDLPSPNCQWTPRRKAEVVAAFAGGLLSTREVHGIYGLSVDEFADWQRAGPRFDMLGLK